MPTSDKALILYVDDSHANRVVFGQTFGKRFRLRCVASGVEALEIATRERIALLVSDQRMPGMSGNELLARFKTESPDTVRVMVTAYSDLEPILRAVNDGLVVRYIIKPWDRAELEEVLRWALEVYELGRANSAIQLRLVQTERLATLGQVTSAVIHDLRHPLSLFAMNTEQLAERASISLVVQQLASRAPDELLSATERAELARLGRDLPEIADELRHTAKLMGDILDQLAAFEHSRTASQQSTDVDPVPLVRLAIAMCREEAAMARCLIVNDVPAQLPRVRAPSSQLLQILINLVRNGVEAVDRKGPSGIVALQAADQGKDVCFVVRDDGPGMTPDVLAKVGTPFFTTRADGTGLGVAQVRRLVGALGGSLRIESKENRGTVVTFTIPQVGAPAEGRAATE